MQIYMYNTAIKTLINIKHRHASPPDVLEEVLLGFELTLGLLDPALHGESGTQLGTVNTQHSHVQAPCPHPTTERSTV